MKYDLPDQILDRLPYYYEKVMSHLAEGKMHISSSDLAESLNVDNSLCRRDMREIEITGVQRVGYDLKVLCRKLSDILGYGDISRGIVVGSGNLGKAIADFSSLPPMGLLIIDLFDCAPEKIGEKVGIRKVKDCKNLPEYLEKYKPDVAVLTTTPEVAQKITDILVRGDIKGIWNFTQRKLVVPERVQVYYSNLSIAWSVLSHQIKMRTKGYLEK